MQKKISYDRALSLILEHVPQGPTERVGIMDLTGRILAEDVAAGVDSPSVDASLKDGYALYSDEVASAGPDARVKLTLANFQVAGDQPGAVLEKGTAVKVTTGAPLPPGADAVLSREFAEEKEGFIWCENDAGPGRNVLARGTDVRAGEILAQKGQRMHPALIGLLAAAGLDSFQVYVRPTVAVIATGDEVVAPGSPLPQGKLFASNMVEIASWLSAFGLTDAITRVAPDKAEVIAQTITGLSDRVDIFVSSGGAWTSERDLMLKLLEDMGWQGVFHRLRLGPGKAAGFGLLSGKPFFILPGGPPSCEAAFLLLALPGIMAACGRRGPVFPILKAKLAVGIQGQDDWTEVVHAVVANNAGELTAWPIKAKSRLSSMARKKAIILVREGQTDLPAGSEVEIMALDTDFPPE